MAEEIRRRRLEQAGVNEDGLTLVRYLPLGKNWTKKFLGQLSTIVSE